MSEPTDPIRIKKLAELRAQAQEGQAKEAAAKKRRDEDEELHCLEAIGLDYDSTHIVVDLGTASDLPGCAVIKPLTPQEFRQLQAAMKSKDPDGFLRGVVERHLAYPPKDKWAEVMERHPGAYQEPVKLLISRANGDAPKA